MGDIKINKDSRKVLFSDDLIEKIRYLIKNIGVIALEKKYYLSCIKNNELDFEILKTIVFKVKDSIDRSIPFIESSQEILKEISPDLYAEVMDVIRKYGEVIDKILQKLLKEEYFDELEDFLNVAYDYKVKSKDLHLLDELYELKDNCMDNMSYFKTDYEKDKFLSEYEKALKDGDVQRVKNLFLKLQGEILQEWEKYVGDIDEMTDDNFCFIGHSINTFSFNGGFKSNYVSNSLFTQDLNDTYHFPYGFIMKAKNIVCAKSEDMFVDNNALRDQDLLIYCSMPMIDHPKKVLEESLLKKRKAEMGCEFEKVYNEIVEKGFEPIGIFCFSDGTKEIDRFYRGAYELQKNFPHLKVKVFDTFKNKKGSDLISAKIKMLENLEDDYNRENNKSIINRYFKEGDLDRYSFFFEEFAKLKQKGDYDIDDIRRLYRKNKEYIKFGFCFNELFTDKYSDEERKFILENNYALNIRAILKNDMDEYLLKGLAFSLRDNIGKLNKYYPGLDEFVMVVDKVSIDNEIVLELKKLPDINFLLMTKLILNKTDKRLRKKTADSKRHLVELEEKYNAIVAELTESERRQKKAKYYKQIYDNKGYYPLIKKDYLSVVEEIGKICSENKALSEDIFELNDSLRSRRSKDSNIYKLILNLKKLKILEKGFKLCKNLGFDRTNGVNVSCKSFFGIKRTLQILRIRNQLDYLESQKEDNLLRLNKLNLASRDIEDRARDLFDCQVEEIKEKLDAANQYISSYDYCENYNKYLLLVRNLKEVLFDIKLERERYQKNNCNLEAIDEFKNKRLKIKG